MLLTTIQNYSDTYSSAYNAGWMIGLILHICLALGVLRLITWGLRALFSNTMMKGDKRRAAFAAFGIASGLAILYVIVTRMNMPTSGYEYIPGRGTVRVEYWYLGIVPVIGIYLSMLVLWLIVDLKLADRDQPAELSIFSKEETPTPPSQQAWPNSAPYQPYAQYPPPYPQQYPQQYPPAYSPPQYVSPPPQYAPHYANSYPPPNAYQTATAQMPPGSPAPTVQSYGQQSPPPTTPSTQPATLVDEAVPNLIRQLASLRDSGVLSKEEFEEKKTQLLNRIS